MQGYATPELQIAHYAVEYIDARDAHKRASPDRKDDARDEKHKKERALDKAVKENRHKLPTTKR
jgi:hypothetical protein